jgi:hypothetical protein
VHDHPRTSVFGVVWVRLVFSVVRRSLHFFLACALVSASAGLAHAGTFELFGVHPVGLAEASARTAVADDGSACFYNPGGLGLGRGYQLELSGLGMASRLEVQDERRDIDDPISGTFTVGSAVPLEGMLRGRVRVGVAVHALPDRLMRLKTRSQSTPFFPYYDNRSQRFAVIPALALRLTQGFGVGVGVNALAGVQGPLDVREGQSRTLETRIAQEAGTVARWIVGVRFDPTEKLHLGAVFRQRFGVPLTVSTTADVAGVPLSVDVSTAEALFDPMTVVVGGRFEPSDRWSIGLDATYQQWSSWDGPLLQVDTTVSALSLVSKPPRDLFQDVYGARVAVAWQVVHTAGSELALHLGAGFETSMLDASKQQGRSNFVDGPKMILGTGLSARWPGAAGQALRLGLGVQMHRVARFEQDKIACTQLPCPATTVVGPETANPSEDIDNPGYPSLSGGGTVFAASIGVGVEL